MDDRGRFLMDEMPRKPVDDLHAMYQAQVPAILDPHMQQTYGGLRYTEGGFVNRLQAEGPQPRMCELVVPAPPTTCHRCGVHHDQGAILCDGHRRWRLCPTCAPIVAEAVLVAIGWTEETT